MVSRSTAAVAVQRRGDGDNGEIVLVAAQRAALRRQHADDGVGDAVDFESCSPTAEPKGKTVFARAAPNTHTSRASSTSRIHQHPALLWHPVRARETPRGFAEHRHRGRGFGVAGLDAWPPQKWRFDADAPASVAFCLHLFVPVRWSCSCAASISLPDWLPSGPRPFSGWRTSAPPTGSGCVSTSPPAPHRRHHYDDREYANQHANQRERQRNLCAISAFMAIA